TVALHLVLEGPHLLAVAQVAALADVDIAAGELQRRVGTNPFDALDRGLDREQGNDLDQTADRHGDQGQDDEEDDVGFDFRVTEGHCTLLRAHSAAAPTARAGTLSTSPRMVRQTL